MRYYITIIRVRSHERRNELIPVWDFKLAWKQALFKYSFISTAFQHDPIVWWACVGISFRVVFTCILSPKMKFHFCQNDWYEIRTHVEFQTHMRIKRNIQQICTYSFRFGKIISCRFEISFRSKWPIWNRCRFEFYFASTQVKSWLNTKVRSSTEMKSHTGLSSFHFSCERTLIDHVEIC